MPPRLYVNVDHVATLRQQRDTGLPDPVLAAGLAELAGAEGITVHLREDRRHIQDRDVQVLRETVRGVFNLEMAATDEMIGIAISVKPDFCTLVPEKRMERTTEGGLDVRGAGQDLRSKIARLRDAGIAVSLFIDPDPSVVEASREAGAGTVELHTGDYAHAVAASTADPAAVARELARLARAGQVAIDGGLQLAAGHGLDVFNVGPVAGIKGMEELNIGHGIVGRAVMIGMERAIVELRAAIAAGAAASTGHAGPG